METNNTKIFKKQPVNVNFTIIKTPEKTLVFYYKKEQTYQNLINKIYNHVSFEIIKTGKIDLDTFLDNKIIEFAIIEAIPYKKFSNIVFGLEKDNLLNEDMEYSFFKTYSEDQKDRKFFKSKDQYFRCIFRLRDISKELLEKHYQFHELEDLADLLGLKEENKEDKKGEEDNENNKQ